jgi:hypothetical protein
MLICCLPARPSIDRGVQIRRCTQGLPLSAEVHPQITGHVYRLSARQYSEAEACRTPPVRAHGPRAIPLGKVRPGRRKARRRPARPRAQLRGAELAAPGAGLPVDRRDVARRWERARGATDRGAGTFEPWLGGQHLPGRVWFAAPRLGGDQPHRRRGLSVHAAYPHLGTVGTALDEMPHRRRTTLTCRPHVSAPFLSGVGGTCPVVRSSRPRSGDSSRPTRRPL